MSNKTTAVAEPKRLLTTRQVAEMMGVSERTVFDFSHKAGLKFLRLGRSIRFDMADVTHWLEQRKH